MFATEPFPRRLIPAPCYADFGYEYFRQLPDGRLLAGGGRRAALEAERTHDERPSEPVQSAIERFFYSCYPEARAARITHRWAGIMGFTADEWPLIGPAPEAPPTVLVCAGYHGHGMGLAAQAVSSLLPR
jgi:glycine/D-amino acid oxidase-like deaminating enzyme